MIAMLNRPRFCWCTMLLSRVHQDVEALFCFAEKGAIFQSTPADERNRFHSVARQVTAEPPFKVFVQEDSHLMLGSAALSGILQAPRSPARAARLESPRGNRRSNRPPPGDRTCSARARV